MPFSRRLRRWHSCVVLLAWPLALYGCSKQEDALVRATIAELQDMVDQATRFGAASEYSALCVVPACRRGLALLKKDGAQALRRPVLLWVRFKDSQGVRSTAKDRTYFATWLGRDNDIKGLYLRLPTGKDRELYPKIVLESIGVRTAWKCAGGPIVVIDEDEGEIREDWRDQVITIEKSAFADKQLSVGLILEDGTKTEPVRVFFTSEPKPSSPGDTASHAD